MIYTYKCIKCKRKFDETMTVLEYMADTNVPRVCPHCVARTGFRIISKPTIIYNGTGFYSSDNRKKDSNESSV